MRRFGHYSLFLCLSCRLQFWDPRELYPDFYEDEQAYAYILFHRGALNLPKWNEWFLKNHDHAGAEGKKLLDIGCGNGLFLSEAQKFGYDVYGIDLDAKSISVARQKYGLDNVHAMNLERFVEFAEAMNLSFDEITFFEVLEHQPDPQAFLESVKRLLKPGGRISGSVPNRDRAYAEGDRKNGDDLPPHHFLWLNEEALRNLFARFDLRNLSVHRLTYSLWEYSAWLQNMYLGFISNRARDVAAKTILKEGTSSGFRALDWIKRSRNVIFFPVALATFPYYLYVNRRGWDLCFSLTDE